MKNINPVSCANVYNSFSNPGITLISYVSSGFDDRTIPIMTATYVSWWLKSPHYRPKEIKTSRALKQFRVNSGSSRLFFSAASPDCLHPTMRGFPLASVLFCAWRRRPSGITFHNLYFDTWPSPILLRTIWHILFMPLLPDSSACIISQFATPMYSLPFLSGTPSTRYR